MLCVCVGDVMNVVFYVCIVSRGAVGARVWEVLVFRHADVVCLCIMVILWKFSMLRSARLAVCYQAVCYGWSMMQKTDIWKRHTPEPVS